MNGRNKLTWKTLKEKRSQPNQPIQNGDQDFKRRDSRKLTKTESPNTIVDLKKKKSLSISNTPKVTTAEQKAKMRTMWRRATMQTDTNKRNLRRGLTFKEKI